MVAKTASLQAGVGAGQSPPPADAAVVRGSGEGAAATGPGAPATFRFGALSCAAFVLGPRLSGLWLAGAGLGPAEGALLAALLPHHACLATLALDDNPGLGAGREEAALVALARALALR